MMTVSTTMRSYPPKRRKTNSMSIKKNPLKFLALLAGSLALAATSASAGTVPTWNFAGDDLVGWTVTTGVHAFEGNGVEAATAGGVRAHDAAHPVFVLTSPQVNFHLANVSTVDNVIDILWEGGAGNQDAGPDPANLAAVVNYNGGNTNAQGQKGLGFRNLVTGNYDFVDYDTTDGGGVETRSYTRADLIASGINPDVSYQLDFFTTDDGGWGWTRLDQVNLDAGALEPIPMGDSDNDTIDDATELALVGNLDDLSLGDFDNDGVTDPVEINDDRTDPTEADIDNDLLNDGAEKAAGTDPFDPDSDDDGRSDGSEVNGGILVLADFGSTGPNANGSPAGWDGVPNLIQDDPFALSGGVTLTARDDGFNPNNTGAPNAPQTVDGTDVPVEANNDYLFKIADQAGTEAIIEIGGLPAARFNLSLFEGRTSDANQVAKIWVGFDPEPASANTGSFANGSTTMEIEVGAGETVFYKHLEDGSGGLSGLIIRELGFITDPLNRDTDGDGAPDGFEIDQGTDPTDPNDTPATVLVQPSFTPIIDRGAGAIYGPGEPGWDHEQNFYNGGVIFNNNALNNYTVHTTGSPAPNSSDYTVQPFLDFGGGGAVPNNLPFPSGGGENFTTRGTAYVEFTQGGDYVFHHGADDTTYTVIDTGVGGPTIAQNNCCGNFSTPFNIPGPGFYPVDFVFGEQGGGEWLDLGISGPGIAGTVALGDTGKGSPAVFTISFPDTDSDGDGLADAFEQRLIDADPNDGFNTLADILPGDDFDNDGSTNAQEFENRTDGTDSDSDDDGSNDGDEQTNMTDPNDEDSDDDGLLDGVETNTGIFNGPNDTGTDPNDADTDGDLVQDGKEVELNSNPNDGNDKPALPVIVSLGTGVGALIGGDLTDPENDGIEGVDPGAGNWDSLNWNWFHITASGEPYFGNHGGSEGAFDLFDNQVGPGQAKWCCDGPVQWLTVEFAQPVALDSFTVTSGNDVPGRDPLAWTIDGSNDGVDFETIFEQDDAASLWTQRLEVIHFILPKRSKAYKFIRYQVTRTGGNHQINELEYFGVLASDKLFLDVDRSPADPNMLRLTWDATAGKVYDVLIDAGLNGPIDSWAELAGSQDIPADPSGTNTLDIPHPFAGEGFVAIREEDAPPLYFEDFESGGAGWTTLVNDANSNTLWELGTPSGTTGPTTGADGSANAYSTNLGDYGPDSDIVLRSPPIDLAGLSGAELNLKVYRDADGFADTGTVRFLKSSDLTPLGADIDLDLTILDGDWTGFSSPVPAAALGESVIVEIHFISDASGDSFSGLSIDNVGIKVTE